MCVWLTQHRMLMSMVQFMSVDQMFCVELALARILHGYCRTYACHVYSALMHRHGSALGNFKFKYAAQCGH